MSCSTFPRSGKSEGHSRPFTKSKNCGNDFSCLRTSEIIFAGTVLFVLFGFITQAEEQKIGTRLALVEAVEQALENNHEIRAMKSSAAVVVAGSFVMLFDPIFHGLAIAMMFGAVASTLLTLIVVPLLCYEFFKINPCPEEGRKEKGGEESLLPE